MNQPHAQNFFENFLGKPADEFVVLAKSGSERINYKASSESKNYIITYNENLRENEAFFYFSELFERELLNTPKIFVISEDRKLYIQEFLGEKTLSQIIEAEGLSDRVKILVKQTLQKLFELQTKTLGKTDFSKTFEYEVYNSLPILHDLYYFKNFAVDVLEIHYHKSTLLKEFNKIVSLIANLQPKGLIIRDFQSRNIMVDDDNNISFIDYQGAMQGPLMYDVVSFLYQAKANFDKNFRKNMLDYYYGLWADKNQQQNLRNSLEPLKLMRFLQVLGAYGFRGLIQHKAHFMSSIHQGIENIYRFSLEWNQMNDFPELKKVISELHSEKITQKIAEIIKK